METALNLARSEMFSALTPRIVKGEEYLVFHNEWDNLSKVLTNVHGSHFVNSAGGIMLQEVNLDYECRITRSLPCFP